MNTLPQRPRVNDLHVEVNRMADEALEILRASTGSPPDFSRASLAVVDAALEEASAHPDDFTKDQSMKLVQRLGCYFLEVLRREVGGTYKWYRDGGQPALVIGEPQFHISIIAWERVAGRLAGNKGDSVVLYFEAVLQHVRAAKPGTRAIYA